MSQRPSSERPFQGMVLARAVWPENFWKGLPSSSMMLKLQGSFCSWRSRGLPFQAANSFPRLSENAFASCTSPSAHGRTRCELRRMKGRADVHEESSGELAESLDSSGESEARTVSYGSKESSTGGLTTLGSSCS